MEKKNLAQVAIILATFLLAVPAAPARATTPATLSISPSSVTANLGGSFTASVMISTVANLQAFDFKVLFNPNIVQVTSTTLGHTAFDLNNNGDISDDPVLVAKADVLNPVGIVRYAVVLLGGATFSGSGPLLFLTFQVKNALGGTASDVPSPITVDEQLVGLDPNTGMTFSIPAVIGGGVSVDVTPVPSVVFRSVGCRAAIQGFNVHAHGFTDGMFCRIVNSGTAPVGGAANFNWHSINGVTGSANGAIAPMAPGQTGETDASITLPSGVASTDIVIITGTAFTFVLFPDGSVLAHSAQGPSQTFIIIVNG